MICFIRQTNSTRCPHPSNNCKFLGLSGTFPAYESGIEIAVTPSIEPFCIPTTTYVQAVQLSTPETNDSTRYSWANDTTGFQEAAGFFL